MLRDLPLLSLLIFLPLFGAFFIVFMKEESSLVTENQRGQRRNAWSVGLLTSWATFALSIIVLFYFDRSQDGYQLINKGHILGPLKMAYYVGIDGISLVFILLTTLLTPLALMASIKSIKQKVRTYVVSFLVLETMILGTFCSLDLIFFYIFFEGVLIPMFLIIGIWGGDRRIYSAFKFFLYTFLGSVLMLIAMIVMIQGAGTTEIPLMQTFSFAHDLQFWLWFAFFASFAIKVPMWPFHTWLPDAHVEAPTAGSVILAGVLLKTGGYGFIRFSLPMFPEATQALAPFVFTLSIIGVIYTSLVALAQKDMKKLIAYSSVAHMGLVTFGIFSLSQEGVQGALFQMISHGIVSAALFLCVGVLYDRMQTREIARYGGLARIMPLYTIALMIFTFASIGLPGTSGFIGEILVMIAAFERGGFWAAALGLGMILGAAYALWLFSRVVLGKLEKDDLKKLPDLTLTEKMVLTPLVALVLFLGIYPSPLLSLMDKSVAVVVKPFEQSSTVLTEANFDFFMGDTE